MFLNERFMAARHEVGYHEKLSSYIFVVCKGLLVLSSTTSSSSSSSSSVERRRRGGKGYRISEDNARELVSKTRYFVEDKLGGLPLTDSFAKYDFAIVCPKGT